MVYRNSKPPPSPSPGNFMYQLLHICQIIIIIIPIKAGITVYVDVL